ncbi:MAG: hypothetical protein VSS75_017585 [Candidatus Parabeggiatoa sp.]|nr:hypothetical protein [Candidatus Parabeggiatoa sp.]
MKNKYLLYLSLILAAACSLNALARQPSQVGNIDDFDGALTDYSLKRGSQIIGMRVYEPLYFGDQIFVSKAHSVEIRECGQARTITHDDAPYRVESKSCDVIGLADNIWLSLKDFAKYIVTIVPSGPSVDIYSKSEKERPIMPILEATVLAIPTLKAGKRALFLQWFNGKAPYQVQITTADKMVLWEIETTVQSVKTGEIDFKTAESYWLIITAANYAKQQMELEFEAVAALPDYPERLQDQSLPENLRRTLQAAWLAEQNRVQWSFEAYQQVFDIAEDYGPARALREALERY